MKIIAHGVKDAKAARKAISCGVDFVEIDVSKRFLFNKFTAQHNGLLGILGLGPLLETLLTKEMRARAFLDLKPLSPRNSFTLKLADLLVKLSVKEVKICGHNWTMLSVLSKKISAKPYYTIKNEEGAQAFKKLLPTLTKPVNFSVKHSLVNKKFMKDFKKKTNEIWAWTVNDTEDAKRLMALDVDGIITDNWENTLKLR